MTPINSSNAGLLTLTVDKPGFKARELSVCINALACDTFHQPNWLLGDDRAAYSGPFLSQEETM